MGNGDWKNMISGVQDNDLALVKYYISEGIDLNYQHPEFMSSALIESIRLGHLEMASLLLENGASPTFQEAYSMKTPLSVAKETRNKQMVALVKGYIGKKGKRFWWWF